MPVRIVESAEPLSLAARQASPGASRIEPLLAGSQARSVLSHELERYCQGRLRGRSFLIAGHRGSGKTTMVDSVVLSLQREALRDAQGPGPAQHRKPMPALKPLPVYLQGPMLFGPNDQREAAGQAAPAPLSPAASDKAQHRMLIEVGQALHQAVSMEYSARLHLHAHKAQLQGPGRRAGELAEMAARFQIELTEAPPPSRLHEFWRHANLLQQGVLFDKGHRRGREQGLRELVALTGVSHLYQRISGTLEEKDERSAGQGRKQETSTGIDAKWAEVAKPLAAVASGAAVGAASASAGQSAVALLLGVATALASGLVFKMTSTMTRQVERKLDRTFMPDLTTKTLHRVMPELFERLLAAGLAPVFIVDELDKIDRLYSKIHPLLDAFKKLFAERSFTCLVVDRGFYEELHWREEQERRESPRP